MIFTKKFWIDCIFATAFIFLLMAAINVLFKAPIFDAFDPISVALTDFEMSDIGFSQIRDKDEVPSDSNIVVVNISAPYIIDRKAFAQQIEIINRHKPKVIAVDGFYSFPKPDTLGDLLLEEAFSKVENLVLVSKLIYNDSTELYDSLKRSWEPFRRNAHEGFANLDTDADSQDDFKACRVFPPYKMAKGKKHLAFGVKIAEIFNPKAAEKFLSRGNEWETINYSGNIVDLHDASKFSGKFSFLDWDNVLEENFEPSLIKDKIVIFGFAGENIFDTSWDDKFFTPLNKHYAGRANPDMYGVVVHANIVSMILQDAPIDSLSVVWDIIIGIILCFLNVVLFSMIYHKLPAWYDGLTKLIQLVELGLFLFFIISIFANFSFKLNLTLGLAAIALAGDALEVYYGVVDNLLVRLKKWLVKIMGKVRQKT